MSLWSQYINELRGPGYRHWLEYPDCFVAYSFPEWGPVIFIHDMFVCPEYRKLGRGKELIAELEGIGRKAGKRFLVSELELNTMTFELSFRAQVAVGFVPVAAQNGIITLRKEIGG